MLAGLRWGEFCWEFCLWGQINNIWGLGIEGNYDKLFLHILIDILVELVSEKSYIILSWHNRKLISSKANNKKTKCAKVSRKRAFQIIVLKKLWKMFFISSKDLFPFSRYSNFCISVLPSFSVSHGSRRWSRLNLNSRSHHYAQLGNALQKHFFCLFCFDNGYFKRFHGLIF